MTESPTDGVVLLRPWIASDAEFMFTASKDPEIRRFNGPSPRSIEDATATIADITQAWRAFQRGRGLVTRGKNSFPERYGPAPTNARTTGPALWPHQPGLAGA